MVKNRYNIHVVKQNQWNKVWYIGEEFVQRVSFESTSKYLHYMYI